MLTTSQIQSIYAYCSNIGIQYYDVQSELADHIGSIVEEKMNYDSSLTFEITMEETIASFGGEKGLKDIEHQKEKQLRRQCRKLQWLYIFKYFRWPTILATSLVILFFYYLAYHVPTAIMSVIIRTFFWSLFIYYSILIQVDSKRAMKDGFSGGYRKSNYRQIKPLLVFKNSLFYFQTLAMGVAIISCLILLVVCNAFRYTRRNLINAMFKTYPAAFELKKLEPYDFNRQTN